MILITFDIIDSRKKEVRLNTVFTNTKIEKIRNKFDINTYHIEISGGDQLRLLIEDTNHVIELLIYVYSLLNEYQLKARAFITVGEYSDSTERINVMTGSIFYRNKELETSTKKSKGNKNNFVYYRGNGKTEEINLLLYTFSKLVLYKPEYLKALYLYEYQNLNQVTIASELGLSQSTINNQLIKTNRETISSYNNVISRLIKEEKCKENN